MAARVNSTSVASRRTDRQLLEIGDEFREARLTLELSQASVAVATGMSRNHYRTIEAGRLPTASVHELNRVAAALGLEISVRRFQVVDRFAIPRNPAG